MGEECDGGDAADGSVETPAGGDALSGGGCSP